MSEPKIVKAAEAEPHALHGAGKIFKLLYPSTVDARKIFVGLAVVPPGEAPHVFHRHGVELICSTRIEYAPDFEEFYYIVEGVGTMQWKIGKTQLVEKPVEAGDSIFMPPGCVEHRIFNSGPRILKVLYGGSPPAQVTTGTAPNSGGG